MFLIEIKLKLTFLSLSLHSTFDIFLRFYFLRPKISTKEDHIQEFRYSPASLPRANNKYPHLICFRYWISAGYWSPVDYQVESHRFDAWGCLQMGWFDIEASTKKTYNYGYYLFQLSSSSYSAKSYSVRAYEGIYFFFFLCDPWSQKFGLLVNRPMFRWCRRLILTQERGLFKQTAKKKLYPVLSIEEKCMLGKSLSLRWKCTSFCFNWSYFASMPVAAG